MAVGTQIESRRKVRKHAEPDAPASWQQVYTRRFYTSQTGWRDGTSEFWDFISLHAVGSLRVLEVGPGPANQTTAFLANTFDAVEGLDIDPDAQTNPDLAHCYLYDGGGWPCEAKSYDAVVSNYVLEHVADPRAFVAEAHRALKPGGVFLFRTPNLWHYTSLVSRLTPHWFHNLVANRLRNLPRDAHDPYPTFYRLNSRRAVLCHCNSTDWEPVEIRLIEKQPSYGMSSRILFLTFMAYERLVNKIPALSGLRANILAAYRRRDE